MTSARGEGWRSLGRVDEVVSSAALALIMLVPIVEIVLRPLVGRGIENAPMVVQHLGLVLAMFGAVAAERHGHLVCLGGNPAGVQRGSLQRALHTFAQASAACLCGALACASWRFVASELPAAHALAYGIPTWLFQACMPAGFALLGIKLGLRSAQTQPIKLLAATALPLAGFAAAAALDGNAAGFGVWATALWLVVILLAGAPIFAVLGGLGLLLFWQEGQPIASIPLSHYQITVNPSLPALPLFTLAGLVFARTGAAGWAMYSSPCSAGAPLGPSLPPQCSARSLPRSPAAAA